MMVFDFLRRRKLIYLSLLTAEWSFGCLLTPLNGPGRAPCLFASAAGFGHDPEARENTREGNPVSNLIADVARYSVSKLLRSEDERTEEPLPQLPASEDHEGGSGLLRSDEASEDREYEDECEASAEEDEDECEASASEEIGVCLTSGFLGGLEALEDVQPVPEVDVEQQLQIPSTLPTNLPGRENPGESGILAEGTRGRTRKVDRDPAGAGGAPRREYVEEASATGSDRQPDHHEGQLGTGSCPQKQTICKRIFSTTLKLLKDWSWCWWAAIANCRIGGKTKDSRGVEDQSEVQAGSLVDSWGYDADAEDDEESGSQSSILSGAESLNTWYSSGLCDEETETPTTAPHQRQVERYNIADESQNPDDYCSGQKNDHESENRHGPLKKERPRTCEIFSISNRCTPSRSALEVHDWYHAKKPVSEDVKPGAHHTEGEDARCTTWKAPPEAAEDGEIEEQDEHEGALREELLTERHDLQEEQEIDVEIPCQEEEEEEATAPPRNAPRRGGKKTSAGHSHSVIQHRSRPQRHLRRSSRPRLGSLVLFYIMLLWSSFQPQYLHNYTRDVGLLSLSRPGERQHDDLLHRSCAIIGNNINITGKNNENIFGRSFTGKPEYEDIMRNYTNNSHEHEHNDHRHDTCSVIKRRQEHQQHGAPQEVGAQQEAGPRQDHEELEEQASGRSASRKSNKSSTSTCSTAPIEHHYSTELNLTVLEQQQLQQQAQQTQVDDGFLTCFDEQEERKEGVDELEIETDKTKGVVAEREESERKEASSVDNKHAQKHHQEMLIPEAQEPLDFKFSTRKLQAHVVPVFHSPLSCRRVSLSFTLRIHDSDFFVSFTFCPERIRRLLLGPAATGALLASGLAISIINYVRARLQRAVDVGASTTSNVGEQQQVGILYSCCSSSCLTTGAASSSSCSSPSGAASKSSSSSSSPGGGSSFLCDGSAWKSTPSWCTRPKQGTLSSAKMAGDIDEDDIKKGKGEADDIKKGTPPASSKTCQPFLTDDPDLASSSSSSMPLHPLTLDKQDSNCPRSSKASQRQLTTITCPSPSLSPNFSEKGAGGVQSTTLLPSASSCLAGGAGAAAAAGNDEDEDEDQHIMSYHMTPVASGQQDAVDMTTILLSAEQREDLDLDVPPCQDEVDFPRLGRGQRDPDSPTVPLLREVPDHKNSAAPVPGGPGSHSPSHSCVKCTTEPPSNDKEVLPAAHLLELRKIQKSNLIDSDHVATAVPPDSMTSPISCAATEAPPAQDFTCRSTSTSCALEVVEAAEKSGVANNAGLFGVEQMTVLDGVLDRYNSLQVDSLHSVRHSVPVVGNHGAPPGQGNDGEEGPTAAAFSTVKEDGRKELPSNSIAPSFSCSFSSVARTAKEAQEEQGQGEDEDKDEERPPAAQEGQDKNQGRKCYEDTDPGAVPVDIMPKTKRTPLMLCEEEPNASKSTSSKSLSELIRRNAYTLAAEIKAVVVSRTELNDEDVDCTYSSNSGTSQVQRPAEESSSASSSGVREQQPLGTSSSSLLPPVSSSSERIYFNGTAAPPSPYDGNDQFEQIWGRPMDPAPAATTQNGHNIEERPPLITASPGPPVLSLSNAAASSVEVLESQDRQQGGAGWNPLENPRNRRNQEETGTGALRRSIFFAPGSRDADGDNYKKEPLLPEHFVPAEGKIEIPNKYILFWPFTSAFSSKESGVDEDDSHSDRDADHGDRDAVDANGGGSLKFTVGASSSTDSNYRLPSSTETALLVGAVALLCAFGGLSIALLLVAV
ncbi:unnamed protein product [Amoebophrya sp. A25]|nr:unnamed protein product [Amoebophrya sp. A25]|eukprot:GSA25T00015460001.1